MQKMPCPIEFMLTLHDLFSAGQITQLQYFGYLKRQAEGEVADILDELYRKSKLSYSQFNKIKKAIERDAKAQAKERKRKIFGAINRQHGRRSPVAQGGLPSLGKRRP